MFIASQICSYLSTLIMLSYSVMKLKRGPIIVCNLAIHILITAHYLLLGDSVGAACTAVCGLMLLAFVFKRCNKLFSGVAVPVFFGFLLTVSAVLTWKDNWSHIPLAGNLLLDVAFWNDDPRVIKGLCIIVGLMWIVYNIHLNSPANIIGQILSVTSNVIYFVRIGIDRKKGKVTKFV